IGGFDLVEAAFVRVFDGEEEDVMSPTESEGFAELSRQCRAISDWPIACWEILGTRSCQRRKNFRMYSRLDRENPFPNSSVSRSESSFSSSAPYAARFFPFCSYSTMRRPISKLVIT